MRISFTSWLPGTHKAVPAFTDSQHETNHVGNFWPTINQVADEHELASFGMLYVISQSSVAVASLTDKISKLGQQIFELIKASMNVTDDVERAVLLFEVIPKRLTDDFWRIDIPGDCSQGTLRTPSVLVFECIAQLSALLANHVRPETSAD